MSRRPDRRQPRRVHTPLRSGTPAREPRRDDPLMAAIRTALRAPSAHALLDWASVTIETPTDRAGACTDPSHGHPVHAPASHVPSLLELVESFVGVPCTETTAALHILRALSNDGDVRAVATHGLATRRHPMPLWLAHLDEARCVPDVVRITEELGDSTSQIVGVRLVGGELRTALRRTAAAIAVGNPDFLRRKSDDARGAAALLTLVLQAHGVIGWSRVMRRSQIVTEFGLTGSVTQRMEPMMRGLGISRTTADWGLGDPALLTARQRAVLIDMWDEYGD